MSEKKEGTNRQQTTNPLPAVEAPKKGGEGVLLQRVNLIIAIGTIIAAIVSGTLYVSHRISQIESRLEKIESHLKEQQADIAKTLPGNWEVEFKNGDRGTLSFELIDADHVKITGHQNNPKQNIIVTGTGEIKEGSVKLNYNVFDNSKPLYGGQSVLYVRGPVYLEGWVLNDAQPKNYETVTLKKMP